MRGLEIWKGVKPEGENVRLLQSADAITGFEATDLRSLPVKELVSLLWTELRNGRNRSAIGLRVS